MLATFHEPDSWAVSWLLRKTVYRSFSERYFAWYLGSSFFPGVDLAHLACYPWGDIGHIGVATLSSEALASHLWHVQAACKALDLTQPVPSGMRCAGGFREHQGGENNEEVQKAAEFAVSEVRGASNALLPAHGCEGTVNQSGALWRNISELARGCTVYSKCLLLQLPGDGLKLQKVVSVHKQTVAGINYKLVLEVADDSGATQHYCNRCIQCASDLRFSRRNAA